MAQQTVYHSKSLCYCMPPPERRQLSRTGHIGGGLYYSLYGKARYRGIFTRVPGGQAAPWPGRSATQIRNQGASRKNRCFSFHKYLRGCLPSCFVTLDTGSRTNNARALLHMLFFSNTVDSCTIPKQARQHTLPCPGVSEISLYWLRKKVYAGIPIY
jgi:hypothetical protein